MNSNDIAIANCRFAFTALSRLSRLGVRDVVISSGARCAPMVWAASQCSDLRLWTHPDERSAGFFALGAAKSTQRPVILICTSGTAGANYFPSVIEAFVSHVPLLVMTADRPPELQGRGASQTIDQGKLFGRYAKRSMTLPPPEVGAQNLESEWVSSIESAYAEAIGWPAGPVHLNVQFREPLLPEATVSAPDSLSALKPASTIDTSGAGHLNGPPNVSDTQLDRLLTLIRDARCGLIIAGPQFVTNVDPLYKLASLTGFPILADIASQARFVQPAHATLISSYDLILRNSEFATAARPDLVLRFGGLPTSKVLSQWLVKQETCTHVLITGSHPPADPDSLSSLKITSSPDDVADKLCERLTGSDPSGGRYRQFWQVAEGYVQTAVGDHFESGHSAFEGRIVAEVFKAVTSDTRIMLGNSMPIRWAEMYAWGREKNVPVLFNRGVNGIDGVVSTAVGAAASTGHRVVLIVGDVSFIHDLAGLLPVNRYPVDITIVVLNNDGGGIFSFLPLAQHDAIFESLVAMPHGRSFKHIAAFYEIPYQAPGSIADFRQAFTDSLNHRGATLLELRADRATTVAINRSICDKVRELDLV